MNRLQTSIPQFLLCCFVFAGTTLYLLSTRAQDRAQPADERLVFQWENKFIKVETCPGGSINLLTLRSQLNEQGIEGWECAGAIPTQKNRDEGPICVMLKRVKQ